MLKSNFPFFRFTVLIAALGLISCATGGLQRNKSGLQHLSQGRYSEAEADFKAAIEENKSNATYYNNLGVACFEQGRLDEAITNYKKGIDLDQTDALLHKNYGDALFIKGEFDKAIVEFRKSIDLNTSLGGPKSSLIKIAFNQGESLDPLIKEFDSEISKTTPEGVKEINKAFLSEQAIIDALILQGKFDESINRCTAAISVLSQTKTEEGGYVIPIITPFFFYIKTVPKTNINVKPILSSLYNYRGISNFRIGNFDQAIKDFKSSMEFSSTGFGNLNIARTYYELKNIKEANYYARKFVEANPNHSMGRLVYASSLKSDGSNEEAELQLSEALKRANGRVNTYLNSSYEWTECRATTYESWGNTDEAILTYTDAITKYKYSGISYKNSAKLLLQKGQNEAAKIAIFKAANLIPSDSQLKQLMELTKNQ